MQAVQIRRVLLLFALVLGLSALVASLAPAPDTGDEGTDDTTVATTPEATPLERAEPLVVRFSAGAKRQEFPTRRVPLGSSFVLEVSVPGPGDVLVDELGLRQSADPLTPARFAILAQPPGGYAVGFVPATGERILVGEVEFVEPASATRPRRDR
jgi:hypothetical protein